jgi:alpha-N-acetylglucosamine transferase
MRAYITLLSTSNYLPGVACLAASLRRTGTQVPLVIAVSHGVAPAVREQIAAMAGVTRVLVLPEDELVRPGFAQGHYWENTFDKLRLFGLREFSKLVYLDSDMVVLDSLDSLFDAPHMAAVAAGRLVHPDWTRLNSGLMVIEPQAGLPERIAQTLAAALDEKSANDRPALGDQDLINSYYADWPLAGPHLDQSYNVFFEHVDAYLATGRYTLPGQPGRPKVPGQPLRVVHFVGRDKPWMPRGRLRHLLARLGGQLGPGQREVLRTYSGLLRASS